MPVVTKQMIAEHSREIEVRNDVEKYGFVANTGGSTGKPLRVFRDKRHFWQAYLSPYQEFAEQALNFVNETAKSPLVRLYAYAGAIFVC